MARTKGTEHSKKPNALESFPLWLESRKLLVIVRACRIIGMDSEDRLFRQTPVSRAELVFFQASEIYERANAGRSYPGMEHTLEEVSKLKTAVYMLFDANKISKDDLAAILVQSGKVRKILLALNEENRKRRENSGRKAPQGVLFDDDDVPACNKLPPKRNQGNKPDDDDVDGTD